MELAGLVFWLFNLFSPLWSRICGFCGGGEGKKKDRKVGDMIQYDMGGM